jgi:hypothetical protein
MSKRGKLEVGSGAGIERGMCLQVDTGDNAELVRVVKVDGGEVTVERLGWLARLLLHLRSYWRRLVRKPLLRAWDRAGGVICARRGHPLGSDGWCWCCERCTRPDFGDDEDDW